VPGCEEQVDVFHLALLGCVLVGVQKGKTKSDERCSSPSDGTRAPTCSFDPLWEALGEAIGGCCGGPGGVIRASFIMKVP
jgi:hypothetical protein